MGGGTIHVEDQSEKRKTNDMALENWVEAVIPDFILLFFCIGKALHDPKSPISDIPTTEKGLVDRQRA